MFARNIISPFAFPFLFSPSLKELCIGSKALLIAREINLNVFAL
jgi:hypothetical protein